MRIELMPAYSGDSILITYKDNNKENRNILIDGGIGRFYPRYLKNKLEEISGKGENIDLLIVTHIDDDHIGGILKLFEDKSISKNFIKKVWFNSEKNISKVYSTIIDNPNEIFLDNKEELKTSVNQGVSLEKKLEELKCWETDIIQVSKRYTNYSIFDVSITVLTPNFNAIEKLKLKWTNSNTKDTYTSTKESDYSKSIDELAKNKFIEDKSITNKSSISFILSHKNNNYLFLGDAHPTDVIKGIKLQGYSIEKPLKVEYLKVSHHGSKNNINEELLSLIECEKYLISSNGNKNNHPNKEALARIIVNKKKPQIYFNYDIENSIFSKDDRDKYSFSTEYKRSFEIIDE